MPVRIIFIIIIVAFAQITHGQKQLSITPAVGLTIPFCYNIKPSVNDNGYKVNTFELYPSFNINLQYNSNNRWIFFAGWQAGDNTSVSIKYGDPQKDLTKGRFSLGAFTNRFPLGVGRYVTTCKWFKSERRIKLLKNLNNDVPNDNILYLILFRLNAVAGISLNRKVESSNENSLESFSYGTYEYNVVNRNNASAFIGLNLQFFNYHKDQIQIAIIYSQGLNEVIEADFNYTLKNESHSAKVGSRGSNLTFHLGYPIRLINF